MNPAGHLGTAFAVGFILGAAPGPVQVVLLTEASRGGIRRGLSAMAGANLTLAALGAILALWLSGVTISSGLLRYVRLAGGSFLIYAGAQTWRDAAHPQGEGREARRGAPPAIRGVLAVLLNPGALVFLATTGSALLASASRDGGSALALATLAALVVGVAAVDFLAVVVGSHGRRLPVEWRPRLYRALALLLVGIGAAFLVSAAAG